MADVFTKEVFDMNERNLFEDGSIKEFEYYEFFPAPSNNSLNSTGNIKIVIEQQDLFTLPSEGYLYFEGELAKKVGDFTDDDKNDVALINNSMMYLFGNITYYLGAQGVENINNPGQTSTMMGMLKYSPAQSATEGLSMCWLPDLDYDDNKQNDSMDKRANFKRFSFNVPLKHIFGFMEDYNKILYGLKQEVRLQRVINNDFIQVKDGTNKKDFKITLSKTSLYMPIIKPSLEEENRLYKFIDNKSVVDILFRGRFTQTYNLLENSDRLDWSFQNTTGKPRYLIIGFQKESELNSKSNFSNLELEQIHVELNTRRYPNQDLDINFVDNKYSRIFKESYDFKRKFYDTDEPSSISMLSFKTLYPIFVVDVSKHEDRTNMSNIDIKVKAKLNKAPKEPVTVYGTLISDINMKLESTGKRFNIIK